MKAVFKRGNIVLFGKEGLFWKKAGVMPGDKGAVVYFVRYPEGYTPDLLTEECKEKKCAENARGDREAF